MIVPQNPAPYPPKYLQAPVVQNAYQALTIAESPTGEIPIEGSNWMPGIGPIGPNGTVSGTQTYHGPEKGWSWTPNPVSVPAPEPKPVSWTPTGYRETYVDPVTGEAADRWVDKPLTPVPTPGAKIPPIEAAWAVQPGFSETVLPSQYPATWRGAAFGAQGRLTASPYAPWRPEERPLDPNRLPYLGPSVPPTPAPVPVPTPTPPPAPADTFFWKPTGYREAYIDPITGEAKERWIDKPFVLTPPTPSPTPGGAKFDDYLSEMTQRWKNIYGDIKGIDPWKGVPPVDVFHSIWDKTVGAGGSTNDFWKQFEAYWTPGIGPIGPGWGGIPKPVPVPAPTPIPTPVPTPVPTTEIPIEGSNWMPGIGPIGPNGTVSGTQTYHGPEKGWSWTPNPVSVPGGEVPLLKTASYVEPTWNQIGTTPKATSTIKWT